MRIKVTINELTDVLMLGGFSDDAGKLQDIVLLLDINPKIAVTRMLRMFTSNNKHFNRAFSTIGYPERDTVQKRFRSLRDNALSELEEVILAGEIHEKKPRSKRPYYRKRQKNDGE